MNNLFLYIVAVLIWGSTWFAITFQLGSVPPEVSVAYRFALAGVMLVLWCWIRRVPLRFTPRQHLAMALQGALLFGLNYVCVYLAETRLSSGLVAVIFSLITFFNIFGTRIFFGKPMKPATLISAALGVAGVALVFLPELRQASGGASAGVGAVIAVAATLSACLGNLVAARNQKAGMPVVQLNTFGMLYGSVFVGLYAWLAGRPFVFQATLPYVLSLVYLALFGSVLAFGAYLTLVGRIGADRAGYTGAAIPVVALIMSASFEGLHLHLLTFVGIGLCLAGNVLVLRKPAVAAHPR